MLDPLQRDWEEKGERYARLLRHPRPSNVPVPFRNEVGRLTYLKVTSLSSVPMETRYIRFAALRAFDRAQRRLDAKYEFKTELSGRVRGVKDD